MFLQPKDKLQESTVHTLASSHKASSGTLEHPVCESHESTVHELKSSQGSTSLRQPPS